MTTGGDGRLTYAPALDGVRALAVAAVLAFHAEVGPVHGGFLGVSVFFTLSGYLIATLLLAEHDASGRVALTAFYVRRARRLLPAAWLAIGSVLIAIPWWSAAQRSDLPAEAAAALAQIYNWKVALAPDTYANIFAGEPSPLAHFWSLAIEEQFYLVAPALLALALRRGVRRGWIAGFVGVLIAGAGLASYLLDDADLVYNATFTRAGELLAGVLLALVLARRRLPSALADAAGIVGLVAVVWLCLTASLASTWLYEGGLLAVAAASCCLLLGAHRGALVPRVLGVAWLAAIGRVSYGLYLYHWPVFVLLTPARMGIDGLPLLIVRLAITVALTLASYQLLEMPIRRSRRRGQPFLVAAGCVAVVSVVALVATNVTAPASTPVLASPSGTPSGIVRFDTAEHPGDTDRPTTAPPASPTTSSAPSSPSSPSSPSASRSRSASASPSTSVASAEQPEPIRVVVIGGDPTAAEAVGWLGPRVEVIDFVQPGCPVAVAGDGSPCKPLDLDAVRSAGASVAVVAMSTADVIDPAVGGGIDAVAAALRDTEGAIAEVALALRELDLTVVSWNSTGDEALATSLSRLQLRDRAFEHLTSTTAELRRTVRGLAAERTGPVGRPRVLVLGDSTSFDFASALYGDGGRFDVLWAGEHGCPTVAVVAVRLASGLPTRSRDCHGLAAKTRTATGGFTADVIIVVAGPTELVEQIYTEGGRAAISGDADFVAAHDSEMVALSEVAGDVPIIVATSPPLEVGAFSTKDMARPDRLAAWNAQVERWADHHPNVTVLPFGEAVVAHEAAHGSIRPDGSHPTVAGLAPIVDDLVAPTIATSID